MSAEKVVEAALKSLGKRPLVIPGFRNHLMACLSGGLWMRGIVQGFMKRLAQVAMPPTIMSPGDKNDQEASRDI